MSENVIWNTKKSREKQREIKFMDNLKKESLKSLNFIQ